MSFLILFITEGWNKQFPPHLAEAILPRLGYKIPHFD